MNNFAVVRTFGKQYLVAPGDVIKINAKIEDKKIAELFEVLLYARDDTVLIGQPKLDNVKIKATLLGSFKGEKIRVEKFKPKVRYRRAKGFRPDVSEVKIESLDLMPASKGRAKKSLTANQEKS